MLDKEIRLTRKQLSARWECSQRTVDRTLRNGELPYLDLRLGRSKKPLIRFRLEDVLEFERQAQVGPLRDGKERN
jgi:hypothetical protein